MPDDRKELIAAAARRLLLRRDGKKLTVTDIVNECHITRQTFYYHFEDIPDLLLWMMKRNLKRSMQEASMQSTPEESLKYLITLSLSSRLFVEKAMHAGYREELERLAHRAHPAAVAFPAGLHARADEPDAALPSQRCGGPDAQLDGGGLGAHRRDRARYLPDDGGQHERLCAGRCDAPAGKIEGLKDLTAESKCKKPLHFGFFVYTGLRKCKLRFPGRRGKIRKQTERSAGTWNRTCWRESWQR